MSNKIRVLLCLNGDKNPNKAVLDRRLTCLRYALDSQGIEYTFSAKDDYDVVHLLSNEQYKAYKSISRGKAKNPNAPLIYEAFADYGDFDFVKEEDGDKHLLPQLKKETVKALKEAKLVLVSWPSQKTILRHFSIKTPIEVVSPGSKDYSRENYLDCEIKAFRKFYGLKEEDKIIVNYGKYDYSSSFDVFENVARILPQYEFFFFGGREGMFKNSVRFSKNVKNQSLHYEDNIPLELYHSLMLNTKAIFISDPYHVDSLVLIEAMKQGIPIVSRKTPFLFDCLIEGKTALLGKEEKDFYSLLKNIDQTSFKEEAKEFASNFTIERYGKDLLEAYKLVLKEYK